MRATRVTVFAVVALTGGLLVPAQPATGGDDLRAPTRTVKWAKLSSELAQVLRAQQSEGRGLVVARGLGLAVANGRIRVVVESRASRTVAVSVVVSSGGKVEATHANLVQAMIAPAGLAKLSSATAVAFVRAPRRAVMLG
jgi:hypothetical protein